MIVTFISSATAHPNGTRVTDAHSASWTPRTRTLADYASARATQIRSFRHAIQYHRAKTWWYQDRARRPRTPSAHMERRTSSLSFLAWIDRLWIRRQKAASRLRAQPRIAHLRLWLCIHRREGAWNDSGDPYWGGLQMSRPWGKGSYYVYRADLLSPTEQMRKAELGYRASGYSSAWLEGQWPNTSPPCLGYA